MIQRLILGIITVILLGALAVSGYRYAKTNPSVRKFFGKASPAATPVPSLLKKPGQSQAPQKKEVAAVSNVKIYLIALNDNGKSGKSIGCGDSVVGVDRQIQPTTEPLSSALRELLSLSGQQYQSGFYNTLYQSDLQFQDVDVSKGGIATVYLLGTRSQSGVCDDPRIIAQLKETVMQFPSVQQVSIFINGYPIEQLLPGRG